MKTKTIVFYVLVAIFIGIIIGIEIRGYIETTEYLVEPCYEDVSIPVPETNFYYKQESSDGINYILL